MRAIAFVFLSMVLGASFAQEASFSISVVEVTEQIEGPGIQSFVSARIEDKVLFLGGRTDGLHRRQPWASFQEVGNNTTAYVLDLGTGETWEASLEGLEVSLFEQLQSTNQQFIQNEGLLITTGGYGYSGQSQDHITFPGLVVIECEPLIEAILQGLSGDSLLEFFHRIEDPYFAVTGGYLGWMDGVYYLAGGQYFEGRYNPMGPDHGPGFTQEYSERIKRFALEETDGTWSFTALETWEGGEDLHRRDYNMVPQIFPGGVNGFTMFSGVFQISEDVPWLNSVNVNEDGFELNNDFDQMLSQYHSAHMPVYDEQSEAMHTIFFGGMSRFYYNDGELWDDPNVPFVTTISRVTRHADGSMTELKIGDMPDLLGSSAEFIPDPSVPSVFSGIIDLQSLPEEPVLVGHIFGGIESSQPNIFFINNGTESEATQRVFEVYVHNGATGIEEVPVLAEDYFHPVLYPNPSTGEVTLEFRSPSADEVVCELHDSTGKFIETLVVTDPVSDWHAYKMDLSEYAAGIYFIRLASRGKSTDLRVVLQ